MQEVITKEHVWVKHTITPIEVLPGPDGDPVVFVDPEEQEVAEQTTTVYGCGLCYEPLATAFNTDCEGATDESSAS